MKLYDFKLAINNLPDEVMDTEIFIMGENGVNCDPKIVAKFKGSTPVIPYFDSKDISHFLIIDN
jgi:hypothetical protein